MPDSNTRYKDVDYWNERYRTEESFEWFGDFTKFEHLLKQHVGTEENVLMLGKLDVSIQKLLLPFEIINMSNSIFFYCAYYL